MKVLHIVAGLEPGGGMAESVPQLCRYLMRRGHEVTLVTLAGVVSEATEQALAEGVRLVQYRRSWPGVIYFSWQMWRRLGRLAREHEVVQVHSQWTFPVWWGCWCALRRGKPLIMTPRGCFDPVRMAHGAWKKRLVGWLDRWFVRRASRVQVTSELERGWVLSLSDNTYRNQGTYDRNQGTGCDDVGKRGAAACAAAGALSQPPSGGDERVKAGDGGDGAPPSRGAARVRLGTASPSRDGAEAPDGLPPEGGTPARACRSPAPSQFTAYSSRLTIESGGDGTLPSRGEGRVVVVPNGVVVPEDYRSRGAACSFAGALSQPPSGSDERVKTGCGGDGAPPSRGDTGVRLGTASPSRDGAEAPDLLPPEGSTPTGMSQAAAARACRPPAPSQFTAYSSRLTIENGDGGAVPAREERVRRVVYLGRIHRLKGLDLLLTAWERVWQPGWELVVAGDYRNQGTDCDFVIKRGASSCAAAGALLPPPSGGDERVKAGCGGITACRDAMERGVRYIGPVYGREKWELLRGAELLVLPSRSENFGLVVAEALAVGVPVVATQGTPWAELEGHGGEGLVGVNADDADVRQFSPAGAGTLIAENCRTVVEAAGAGWKEPRIDTNGREYGGSALGECALPRCGGDGAPPSRRAARVRLGTASPSRDGDAAAEACRPPEPSQFTAYSSQLTGQGAQHPASNGRCGWWVEVSVAGIERGLRAAMALSDEERRMLGENGRRLVERRYRWEAVAEQMSALYAECVAEQRG